jgi:hypothetical protein
LPRTQPFFDFQELVGSAKRRRQFLILCGLFVLASIVIIAIVLSVVVVNETSHPDHRQPLALEDIIRGGLQPKRFNGTWIDDESFHFFDTNVGFDYAICDFTDN